MSPVHRLEGNEQSKANTEQELPERQKVAQGNSTQPQAGPAPRQTMPPSSSSAPSHAEVAHVVAAITSSDSSPDGADKSTGARPLPPPKPEPTAPLPPLPVNKGAGSPAKPAGLNHPLPPLPKQESAQDSGGPNPQSTHTYPPTNKTQADQSGNSSSAPADGLNQASKSRPLPPIPKQEGSSTLGAAKPQNSGVSSSESKKQEGPAANSSEANAAHTLQELRRPRPLLRPPVQAGPSNSGTAKPSTEASSPALPGRLEPLRRVPSPVTETPEEESGGHPGAASFNTFAGKTTGEVSNVLSEAGGLAGNTTVGKAGEGLFAAGGVWQAGAAASKFSSLLGSASSPEQQKQLLLAGVDVIKGLSNTVSGVTGVVGLNGSPLAGKISSATWSASEGLNALTEGYKAVSEGKPLSKEQIVHYGQIIGSVLKAGGSAASAAGVSGNAPTIAQTVGAGFSIASGALNLHNKGYDVSSTANHYYNNFVGFLQNFRPHKSKPEPVQGQYNPNAHDMV